MARNNVSSSPSLKRVSLIACISIMLGKSASALICNRGLLNHGKPRRSTFLVLNQSRICNLSESGDGASELGELEKEIYRLANQRFNVNSSRQVASIVFGESGTGRSTSKASLQDFIRQADAFGFWLDVEKEDERRRVQVAEKVLEWRAARSSIRKQNKSPNGLASVSLMGESNAVSARLFSTSRPSSDSATQELGSHGKGNVDGAERQQDPMSSMIDLGKSSQTTLDGPLAHLFGDGPNSIIDSYWFEPLESMEKPTSKMLIRQLSPMCPMGFDPNASPNQSKKLASRDGSSQGRKGTLLAYVREQKQRFPDKVILTKVGEFYEAYGIDAIILIEHCGLNSMGEKARAGCPVKNIQATLDCLTSKRFNVAVYEEAVDTDSSTGQGASAGSKSRLKSRFLGQIVSSANPTYMYDLVMSNTGLSDAPSRPFVGVLSTSAGYTMVEIMLEERRMRVFERLTNEAVACRISAYPPADPLIYMPSATEMINGDNIKLQFLSSRNDASSDGPGSRLRKKILPPSLLQDPTPGVSEIERNSKSILRALLPMINVNDGNTSISLDDFVLLKNNPDSGGTNPLFAETATQLGLLSDPNIPSLVQSLLPASAPAACRRFLRRWLLTPPTPAVAESMSLLVSSLKKNGPSLPPLRIPPVGKVLSLIRAGQASSCVYRDICASLDATISAVDQFATWDKQGEITNSLMELLTFESGLIAEPYSLRSRCLDCATKIKSVVMIEDDSSDDPCSDFGVIPKAYFERNEEPWRGRVSRKKMIESYRVVDNAAQNLAGAIARDFWGIDGLSDFDSSQEQKNPVVQELFNNIIAIRTIPKWAPDTSKYYHPRDRRGQILRTRYTTQEVEVALTAYIDACDQAMNMVTCKLTELSDDLCNSPDGHIAAVVQSAHTNLILSTAFHHAAAANIKNWNPAILQDGIGLSRFVDVWPYWMDKSYAVTNTFDLSGMFLLTSPNMSGKSTLMRSTASAALLLSCGLCAPIGVGTVMRRFDTIFVRGASADVPSENKSAFGAEMSDIASLLRSCGDRSLIFVDEIGRGTSPKDGTCLAGAVLEDIVSQGMTGMFATHLHGILDLPMNDYVVSSISNKRMAVREVRNDDDCQFVDVQWTYKLEDGVCRDSMALLTAAKFGVPQRILNRAKEMSSAFKDDDDASEEEELHKPKSSSYDLPSQTYALEHNLETAAAVLEEFAFGEDATAATCHVPPDWSPPASMEGRACVYILELENNNSRSYYVGETGSLSRRISQHRAKGSKWKRATAVAINVSGGKSAARNIESVTIQKLAKMGFEVISVKDGTSVAPIGRN